MRLHPGIRLGPHEILTLVGVGGMGEAYRARDTKLKRDLAIKVLPEDFSHDGSASRRSGRDGKDRLASSTAFFSSV